jgi:hypothetical protein
MGYHHCPIEPSDWSEGPNEPPECPECNGECEDAEGRSCSRCGGMGYLIDDDFYQDYDPEDKI